MHHHKHHVTWQDMSQTQRMATILAAIMQFTLLFAALRDISQRSAGELRGRKAMWVAIPFINFIGPIAYFALGRQPRTPDSEGQISEER